MAPLTFSVLAFSRSAELKAARYRLADGAFTEVPERLRRRWAELVSADSADVVLGDSTSHGLHLVANGLRWRPGDEVLILAGDYPATVLPWQRPGDRGVRTRALHPAGALLTAEELAGAVTDRTRVVALTWVDSFTGRTLDLHALGAVCRQADVLLVVNASQALGARPLDVGSTPGDAVVSCGYKWLCGPYGTGFTWLRPQLREQLEPQHAYWLAMQAGRGLDQMRETELRHDLGVHAFDRFCPADFGDSLPMTAALDVVLGAGVEAIAAHDQALVDRLLAGLDPERYELISPPDGPARSTLVVLRVRTGDTQRRQHALTTAGVDTAYREGALLVSLHLFNTDEQVVHLIQLPHNDRSTTTRGPVPSPSSSTCPGHRSTTGTGRGWWGKSAARHALLVSVVFRPAGPGDTAFLTEMLVDAAFWRPDRQRGAVDDVLGEPELAHYVAAWPRPGDLGVVAEDEHPVGAAWLRLFPADDPGYGFVDADTPEVSMSVVPAWRGRGVGAGLLDALIVAGRDAGLVALSLSVESDNPARRLYERFGFHQVGEVDGSLTMLLRL